MHARDFRLIFKHLKEAIESSDTIETTSLLNAIKNQNPQSHEISDIDDARKSLALMIRQGMNKSAEDFCEIFPTVTHFQFYTDELGLQPLWFALRQNNFSLAQFLINKALENNHTKDFAKFWNFRHPITGERLLHFAASNNYVRGRLFDFLLEHICRQNDKSEILEAMNINGETALHIACQSNSLVQMLFLVELGCDLNKKDNQGRTPLSYIVNFTENTIANSFKNLNDEDKKIFLSIYRDIVINAEAQYKEKIKTCYLKLCSLHSLKARILAECEFNPKVPVSNKLPPELMEQMPRYNQLKEEQEVVATAVIRLPKRQIDEDNATLGGLLELINAEITRYRRLPVNSVTATKIAVLLAVSYIIVTIGLPSVFFYVGHRYRDLLETAQDAESRSYYDRKNDWYVNAGALSLISLVAGCLYLICITMGIGSIRTNISGAESRELLDTVSRKLLTVLQDHERRDQTSLPVAPMVIRGLEGTYNNLQRKAVVENYIDHLVQLRTSVETIRANMLRANRAMTLFPAPAAPAQAAPQVPHISIVIASEAEDHLNEASDANDESSSLLLREVNSRV